MLNVRELAWRAEEELARCDVAECQLACAAGLPGAEKIDVAKCLDWLDRAAKGVAEYTATRMPRYDEDPAVYDKSRNKFRVICLIRYLVGACGLRYNPAKIPSDAPFLVEDTFIHGALFGEGGSCASLPVVYTAVGRRLGYPLKLVASPHHLFCRWDEPGERFNIEASDCGINTPPDDHYRTGPYAMPPDAERKRRYLVSLTRRMEVAEFLAERAIHWRNVDNYKKATESYLWADALEPENRAWAFSALHSMDDWRKQLIARTPVGFPQVKVGIPTQNRRFPEVIPLRVERQFIIFEANERFLETTEMRNWCTVLRNNGGCPAWMPKLLEVMVPAHLWRDTP